MNSCSINHEQAQNSKTTHTSSCAGTGKGLNQPNVAPALAYAAASAPSGLSLMTGLSGKERGDCGGGRVAIPPQSCFCPSRRVSVAGYGLSGNAKLLATFLLYSSEQTPGTCVSGITCCYTIHADCACCHLLASKSYAGLMV